MKIIIIGAGVSGLSAGCYLQMNGFDTEILERNHASGGLCTSWKRGDYTFESGLQWLLGSGPGNPFYSLWSELLDMDAIPFHHHEIRMSIESEQTNDKDRGRVFHLYTNLARLHDYLTGIAPEDTRAIGRFIRTMRRMQSFEIPPMIKQVPSLLPVREKMKLIKHLRLLFFLNNIKKETSGSFSRKLKNPFLKESFRLLFDGDDLPLMIVTMPLAFNDLKAASYPVGGGSRFVRRLEEKYRSLGGKIRFGEAVREIAVKNDVVAGVNLESGEHLSADIVLSAADWHFTLFEALGGRYVDKTILALNEQRRLPVYYSAVMISLGINRDLSDLPHFLRFPLKTDLVSPDGTRYTRMESHIMNYDPTLAPKGKTVVSVCFYTRNADFWIDLHRSNPDLYISSKKEFANNVIGILENKFGQIREFVEVIDIATPATYNRYSGNWKGSVQGWLPGKNLLRRSPIKYTLPGLHNFYYASHWSVPGGGLPVAIKSARDVAQIICHDNHIVFNIK